MTQVLTRGFGGGALARDALAGYVPAEWYEAVPKNAETWKTAAQRVAAEFVGKDWFDALAPAFGLDGSDSDRSRVDASVSTSVSTGASRSRAAHRLSRSANGQGIVITTGQQPGLFGGPIYTWSKALTALALADEIERVTGIPVAPVFWAATDDSDYAEASYTAVIQGADVHVLRMDERTAGPSMADMPLGNVVALFEQFAQTAGSAIDRAPLQAVRDSYREGTTVGTAYLSLLRTMMEPLGISVLDAAHPAVRQAGNPLLQRALQHASDVRDALATRSQAIERCGEYKVQVQPVPNLSLVFNTQDGIRKRVQVKDAARVAASASAESLSPNVLLRPVMERNILPTVTYVAGPAEYAYFAQVTAVADALHVSRPRVVPRWSGLILEPHVREILDELGATVDDFQDPHAIEGRVARAELSGKIRSALVDLRTALDMHTATLLEEQSPLRALRKSVVGFRAQVEHKIDRLERRFSAAIKRSGNERLRHVAMARASLFPNGVPQERLLNIIPFLARYGEEVRTQMIAATRQHAHSLVTSD